MKDGVIKNDGTSRRIYANLPATYEDFRMAAAQGDVLADVLFNADGWQQQPDFLSKRNLMQDSTAALFDLGSDAVPDDALKFIGNFIKGQYAEYEITVKANSWSGSQSAGYTNLITVSDMVADGKIIFVSPVYSTDQDTRVKQYMSSACVNDVSVLPPNVVTITAFSKKPPYDFKLKLLLVNKL